MKAMTFEEVNEMVTDIGLPSAYYSWPEKMVPPLPYVLFYYPGTENFGADNSVYKVIQNLNVELYTKEKDFNTEAAVEAALEAAGLFWNKSESYLTSEHMYEVLYEMEVAINANS